VDFGLSGLYHYSAGVWSALSTFSPQSMVSTPGGFYADIREAGLWKYNGRWMQISPQNCEDIAAVGLN
jgi:hypothetical protein